MSKFTQVFQPLAKEEPGVIYYKRMITVGKSAPGTYEMAQNHTYTAVMNVKTHMNDEQLNPVDVIYTETYEEAVALAEQLASQA